MISNAGLVTKHCLEWWIVCLTCLRYAFGDQYSVVHSAYHVVKERHMYADIWGGSLQVLINRGRVPMPFPV